MKVTRLYTNDIGLSAFEDIELALERAGVEQYVGLPVPTGLALNETEAGHHYDWHNAPARQWVITLQGEIEVQLRDGSTRRFGPGSILLAEDLTGSGHATRVLDGMPWRCAYVPFSGDIRRK